MRYEALIVLVEVVLLAVMPVAAEVGFRAGRRVFRRSKTDEAEEAQAGVVQATTFAILGLLAAFTMSMAESRFTARRQLILDEANAIETTYLRSQYLLPPHDAQLAPLFRSYVDARIEFYAAGGDVSEAERATATATRLQHEIWAHVITIVRADSDHGDTNAELVESVNEMINLTSARLAAIRNHVPVTILALLMIVALASCATTGYTCGLAGRRVWLAVVLLPVLVGFALCVILDLDSPRVGVITTGQHPMIRLQNTLAGEHPGSIDPLSL